MSISSSDISKQTFSYLTIRSELCASENFRAQ